MTHPVYRVTGFEIVGPRTPRVEFDDATIQAIDPRDVLAGDLYGPLQDEHVFRGVKIDPEPTRRCGLPARTSTPPRSTTGRRTQPG